MSNEYITMREIGEQYGVSSHVVGKWLKGLGLRTPEGKPSRAAFAGGFCAQRWAPGLVGYCWAWHRSKTTEVLERGVPKITEG